MEGGGFVEVVGNMLVGMGGGELVDVGGGNGDDDTEVEGSGSRGTTVSSCSSPSLPSPYSWESTWWLSCV